MSQALPGVSSHTESASQSDTRRRLNPAMAMSAFPPPSEPRPAVHGRANAEQSGGNATAPLCCEGASPFPGLTIGQLAERMALFEAQSLEAARDIRRLYRAERARTAELEQARAQMLAYADDLRNAFRAERARRAEVERSYFETVRALALAIDARDPYTGGHVDRVASYAVMLGKELGWSEVELKSLEVGALLHDVGKIGVPDAILRKNGPLDDDEWLQMRQHPTIGAAMLGGLELLKTAVPAVLHHHERYDGQGYPSGLAGADIPPSARIVAIADAFDAMLTDRPYRKGLPLAVSLAELERCMVSQFDPEFTPVFVRGVRDGKLTILKMGSTLA
jgi:HD-GYP domain-containing protein (c-di-GMP phosphodiesterase class II)